MAKQLQYKSQIVQGEIVQSWHVSQSVEAFSAAEQVAYDVSVSGSFKVTGSQFIKPDTLLTTGQCQVLTYNPSTGQIFRANTSSLQLSTDDGFEVYKTASASGGITTSCVTSRNRNTGSFSTIGGGTQNDITNASACAFIGAGSSNCIDACVGNAIVAGCNNDIIADSFGSDNFIGAGNCSCISGCNTSYNVIGGGRNNHVTGSASNCSCSFIGSGCKNLACAKATVVVGGMENTSSANCGFVGGGCKNKNLSISGFSAIVGGKCNLISNQDNESSGIFIGFSNSICDSAEAAIVGGTLNLIESSGGFIGGGCKNKIGGGSASVVGGIQNTASAGCSFIGGGCCNFIKCAGGFIGAGFCNTNNSISGSLVGGQCNILGGFSSFIGGGFRNSSSNNYSVIVGGAQNTGSGACSFIGSGVRNFTTASHSSVVAGCLNRIISSSDSNAFIGGGRCNIIAGWATTGSTNSVIGGGACNKILAATASRDGNNIIGSGQSNIIQEFVTNSSIVGGINNIITGSGFNFSQVGAGSADNFIGGGKENQIRDEKGGSNHNSIVGGDGNRIVQLNHTCVDGFNSSQENFIGGGRSNFICGRVRHKSNAILSGTNNRICFNQGSTILGGYCNRISGSYSNQGTLVTNIIGGGQNGLIQLGTHSGIFTGNYHRISGSLNSAIVSGYSNNINNCPGGGVNTNNSGILTGISNTVKRSINSAIIGGTSNLISGSLCSIIGSGYTNIIRSNPDSSILGGCNNTMCTGTGAFNVITGGQSNKICANVSFGAIVNGCNNCVAHNCSAVIAASGKTTSATDTLYTCNVCAFGNLDISGTANAAVKSFVIPHPDPEKTATYELWHTSIESPTAGDTMYRFAITTVDNEAEIILPEYYRYLNENTQLWVSADGHFGKAFGIVNLSATKIKITSNQDGKYNVMVVGTRKDNAALASWKGAERLKNNL